MCKVQCKGIKKHWGKKFNIHVAFLQIRIFTEETIKGKNVLKYKDVRLHIKCACFQIKKQQLYAFMSYSHMSSLSELGGSSVRVEGELKMLLKSNLSNQSAMEPLLDLAAQSGWFLSSSMKLTGVFWRMYESNTVPLKKACILKRCRSRRRLAGLLHKSWSSEERKRLVCEIVRPRGDLRKLLKLTDLTEQ